MEDQQNKKEAARQPYKTPEVVVYGNVVDITRALGNKNKDNGSGWAHGTH